MEKNRIGMLRKEQNMNQRELGEKLGVGQTTVSAWETGKNEPDMDALHRMSTLFDVSIGYLCGHEAERWPGGIMNPDYQARIRQRMQEEELEKEIREYERQRNDDLTEEEIEKLIESSIWAEWDKTDRSMYFEVFQINKLCENLSAASRKRLLRIVQLAFPKAARGQYEE